MLAEERKEKICNLLNNKKVVRVSELSKRFNVSETTIRHDLDELQDEKKIRRTHGGAVALYPAGIEYVISDLAIENIEAKKMIARKAYDYIEDNDALLFDGSSTVLELCKLIAKGDKKNLIIVTNAFSVVSIMANKKDVRVYHLGGEVKYPINSSLGKITEETISQMRVDKVFLGVNGIDSSYGYSITDMEEAAVKQNMIKSAKQSFVLADHSKFGASCMAKVAEFTDTIDFLITDIMMDDFCYDLYQEAVHLIFCNEKNAFPT